MKQRIFSLFTALCLCLCLLPTSVLATGEGGAAADKWDGSTATGFAGGTGTKADPYQIATGAQLKYLEQRVNSKADYYDGKYLKLTADIDLDNRIWTPIAFWNGGIFRGSFDGGGHTISNLKIDNSLQDCGLFGRICAKDASIEIKDLTVSGSVTGNVLVGGVIGECYGYSGHTLTVSNCHFIGNVTGTGYCVGGVIGECEIDKDDKNLVITVENCTHSGGTVTGPGSVGGVVGYCAGRDACSTITVTGCANSGNVGNTQRVGGVVGYIVSRNSGSVTVENCANSGAVTGSREVGGVIGDCQIIDSGSITVANCLNTGAVSRTEGSDETTFGAVTGVREKESGTITVRDCYYLSGCIAADAGFTGDPAAGLTPLTHAITAALAEVYDETELRAAVAIGAKTIRLMNDIALSETLVVTGKNNITLDLNGRVLSLESGKSGSVIRVGSDSGTSGKLTLTDSSTAEGATDPAPTHKFSVNESTGLWTPDAENGTETVTGGIITGGKTSDDTNGGVYVCAGGSFTMEGGTICGNSAKSGGGVANSGSFTMTGGTICGNTAGTGGGVANHGTFKMEGGSISGNTAKSGGGVYSAGTGSSFTMSGAGEISGNEAVQGGGVYVGSGSFTMESAGVISGNKAAGSSETISEGNGGGVYVSCGGSFTMNGGTISGNSAVGNTSNSNSGHGGGVYVEELQSDNGNSSGTFNLNGGSITGNSAANTANDVTGCGSGNVSSPKSDFTPNTGSSHKVTFKTDENTIYGVEVLSSAKSYATEPAQAPSKPNDTADDYAFGKWYEKDTDGNFAANEYTFGSEVNDDLVLYAKWLRKIKPEHVTVYIDGKEQTDKTNAAATSDGKEHTVTFKVEIDGTTLEENKDYTVTGNIRKTDLGNYDFSISGTGDYAGGWTGGWKIVEAPVTGGSSAATYSITAPTAANGTVTISSKNAKKGAAVTVTVAPDKGYTLETLTILDKNGNEIELTDLGNGQYSFTMPKGKVTVEAAFTEETKKTEETEKTEETGKTEEAAPIPAFSDVPADSYYHDAVLWAAKNGITGGTTATTFSPDDNCGRAQLVTFLWRAAGCPAAEYEMNFSDVGDSYYTEAVRWAASLGIVGGYGNGLFGAEDTITREQMAVILYRFAQAMGMDTTQGGMSVREYKDYDSIADYAVAAIQWAVNSGVMQGYDGNLMPGQPCTRAQIVTMLYRLLGE